MESAGRGKDLDGAGGRLPNGLTPVCDAVVHVEVEGRPDEVRGDPDPPGEWFTDGGRDNPYCLYRIGGPGSYAIISIRRNGRVAPVGAGGLPNAFHFQATSHGGPISARDARRIADAWGIAIPGDANPDGAEGLS
jgi:hypothetical protein